MTELVPHRRVDVAYPDAIGLVNPDKVFHPTFTFGPWIERIGGHALPAEIRKGGAHDQMKLTEPAAPADSGPYDGVDGIFGFGRRGYYADYLRDFSRYRQTADDVARAARTTPADAEEAARRLKQSYGFVTPKTAPSDFRTIINITVQDPSKGGDAGDQHA